MAAHSQTLLLEALVAVVVAPLLGVVVRPLRAQAAAVGAFIVVSFVVHVAAGQAAAGLIRSCAAAHVTMGAAVLALGGLGAACRTIFDDALDAIGATAVLGASAAFGVFLLGGLAVGIPTPLLNGLLTVNPIVAIASAAGIDIFRGAFLYQVSPIAHREFQYPAWQSAALIYGCVAAATFLATARVQRARGITASTH
jgi:hypothetical protein